MADDFEPQSELKPEAGVEGRQADARADAQGNAKSDANPNARPSGATAQASPTLTPADGRAVDYWMDRRDSPQLPQPADVEPARLDRVERLANLLATSPAGAPEIELVPATVDATAHDQSRPLKLVVEPAEPRALALPVRWPEVVAIAAMILMAVSVALPSLVRMREDARRSVDQANLQMAGIALGQYAVDNHGVLPRWEATPGTPWFNVGQPLSEQMQTESNSANLYKLIREQYVRPGDLNSPLNINAPRVLDVNGYDWASPEAVSYSYQNQYTPDAVLLEGQPDMAVLASKNPMFNIRPHVGVELRELSPDAGSALHGMRGQNVLLNDGSANWTTNPVMPDGDNIWLVDDPSVIRYLGTESPAGPGDSFLVP